MLCSISSPRSSSSWLDRLRTSKGFPVPPDLDLEHFLHSNPNPNPNPNPAPPDVVGPPSSHPPDHRKVQQPRKTMGFEKERCLFDLMSNVLCELFVMGDPQEPAAGRKNARKQINPRACLSSISASADVGTSRQAAALSPSSADNSVAGAKKERKKMKRMRANAGLPEDSDLSANAGTVVTVIDTSSPGWKSEKHFRKEMSWKGREEKARDFCRKKRKLGLVGNLLVNKEKLQPLSEFKGREQHENVKLHNEECTLNIIEDPAKEPDYHHIPITRRPKFLRSPRLPVKNPKP